jgi:hypothetical protein
MRQAILILSAATILVGGTVEARSQEQSGQAAQAQQAKPQPPPGPPAPAGQPVNIRVELTISDQSGSGQPEKKTVSMILADRNSGMIRTMGRVGRNNIELNVDAEAAILTEGTIRLNVGLQYQPRPDSQSEEASNGLRHLNQRQTLIVTPGKPIMISQAADPGSDRKITAELTATILN